MRKFIIFFSILCVGLWVSTPLFAQEAEKAVDSAVVERTPASSPSESQPSEDAASPKEVELPPTLIKEIRDLQEVKKRLEMEASLYGETKLEYGLGYRGEVRTTQPEGDSDQRDNFEFTKIQLIPYVIVKNLTPHFHFRAWTILNFEGPINEEIEKRDGEKVEDDAIDNGLALRPTKEFLEAALAALEWRTKVGEQNVVIVIEAGKGKLHIGDFPNSKFLDYSALGSFNIDQTGFVGLGFRINKKYEVGVEIFNLMKGASGDLGQSFNVYGDALLYEGGEVIEKVRVCGSFTHNEEEYRNPNELVKLGEEQDQYSGGVEVVVSQVGTLKLQYIYRNNDTSRDDQGLGVTYDRELKEILSGLHGMLKYEYVDSRNPQRGKHQVGVGIKWTFYEELSWILEVFQVSNGNKMLFSNGKENTVLRTGLSVNW